MESRIVSDPTILFGKPTIRGTRIPVEVIMEKLADGETVESILVSYPTISKEDVLAALEYVRSVKKEGT